MPAPISHIAATPSGSVIAACDEIGMFYSDDDGNKKWTLLSLPFGSKNNRITALSALGNNVFAGTLRGDVFMSSDGGKNWTLKPILTFTDSILAFATSPTNDYFFYISAGAVVYKAKYSGGISVQPIGAVNGGKLFTSLALYSGNGNDSILIGGTLKNGLWIRHDGPWNQVSAVQSTSSVFSVASTPVGVYCTTNNSIFYSANGSQWNTVSNFPNGILSYDAQRHALIAANPLDSVININDTFLKAVPVASIPVKSVHDISAANNNIFAATDSGVYELPANSDHWQFRFSQSVLHTVQKEFPGDIVLLRSRTGNNTIDSSWQADTLMTQLLPPIPITARIVGHLDQVKMNDSTTYSDVIEIRYASEVAGQPAPSVPYWDILYAKNVGPIIIFQISDSVKTRKIYRSR